MVNRNNIKKARKELGLTQQELARRCNCATNTIGRIERGQLQPGMALEQTIAEALGVPVAMLEQDERPDKPGEARGEAAEHLRTVLRLLGQMSAEEVATVSPVVQALACLRSDEAQAGFIPSYVRAPSELVESRAETALPQDFDIVDVEQLPEGWVARFLPIIGRLAAGQGFDTSEAEAYPAGVAYRYLHFEGAPANAFVLAVEGQSMAPQFCHGDLVIVDPDQAVMGGPCVVLVDDGTGQRVARLKRLVVNRTAAKLESANPTYPTTSVPTERVRACKIWRHLSLHRPQPVGSPGYRWS